MIEFFSNEKRLRDQTRKKICDGKKGYDNEAFFSHGFKLCYNDESDGVEKYDKWDGQKLKHNNNDTGCI